MKSSAWISNFIELKERSPNNFWFITRLDAIPMLGSLDITANPISNKLFKEFDFLAFINLIFFEV